HLDRQVRLLCHHPEVHRVPGECDVLLLEPRQPPKPPLFPYTTLFRSSTAWRSSNPWSSPTLPTRSRTATLLRVSPKLCRTACSRDRKSTRVNSSHDQISYAVFCLKKKSSGGSGKGRTDLAAGTANFAG